MRLVKVGTKFINPDQVTLVESTSIYNPATQMNDVGTRIKLTSIHSGYASSSSDYIEVRFSVDDVVALLEGDIDELVELR